MHSFINPPHKLCLIKETDEFTRNSLRGKKRETREKAGDMEVKRVRDLLSNVTLLFSEKSRRDKRRQKGLRLHRDTEREGRQQQSTQVR